MGDEVHNRNTAATALLFKRLAPALVESDVSRKTAAAALDFIAGNDHFFLNLSMAACKAMLDAAANVPGSSLVTAMARNGVNFGIRLAGTGDAWFEAPANPVDGLYFPGYSIADAAAGPRRLRDHRDRRCRRLRDGGRAGDRQVRRRHVGRRDAPQPADARDHARRQPVVHAARRSTSLRGRPASTRARSSTAAILPVINSGIAHREAGVGQIGAGVTTAPMACFTAAVKALARIGSEAEAASVGAHKPLAVVAVGGNALIRDSQHAALNDQYDAVCATSEHVVDDDRRRLERRADARQRSAGRLHPAPLRDRRRASADGARIATRWATRRARSASCSRTRSATRCGAAASRCPSSTLVTQTLVDRERSGVHAAGQADRLVHDRRGRASIWRRARLDGDAGRRSRLAARRSRRRSPCA